MSQRVLSLGCEVHHEDIRCVAFDDPVSLADYDAVVVDPASLTALWAGRDAARLGPGARRELAGRLAHLVWRRRSEATEVLRRGGTIVCFLRPLGTPARLVRPGQQGGRVVLHAYSWLPRERALTGLVVASGRSQAVAPTDQAHPAWRLVESAGGGVAEAFVANETLPEGCRVVATNEDGRPVALEVSVGEGKVVFVPPLAGEPDARGRAIVDFFAPPSAAPAETPPRKSTAAAATPAHRFQSIGILLLLQPAIGGSILRTTPVGKGLEFSCPAAPCRSCGRGTQGDKKKWRRGRDSNPRFASSANTRLPSALLRPLGHLSAGIPKYILHHREGKSRPKVPAPFPLFSRPEVPCGCPSALDSGRPPDNWKRSWSEGWRR